MVKTMGFHPQNLIMSNYIDHDDPMYAQARWREEHAFELGLKSLSTPDNSANIKKLEDEQLASKILSAREAFNKAKTLKEKDPASKETLLAINDCFEKFDAVYALLDKTTEPQEKSFADMSGDERIEKALKNHDDNAKDTRSNDEPAKTDRSDSDSDPTNR